MISLCLSVKTEIISCFWYAAFLNDMFSMVPAWVLINSINLLRFLLSPITLNVSFSRDIIKGVE
jgi:hypothetical protein